MKIQRVDGVYEPREDSFLTVDGVMNYIDEIRIGGMLEIGVGSGYVILSLLDKCPSSYFIGTDINFKAAQLTRNNAIENDLLLHMVCTEFARSFRKGALPRTVVFNPPYLPADASIDSSLSLEERMALVGGKKGTEIMMEYIIEMPKDVTGFFIVSSLSTELKELERALKGKELDLIGEQSFSFEKLWLVRIRGNKN